MDDSEIEKQILEQLNIQFGVMETAGDEEARDWFKSILAPVFAFRRADKITFDDRAEFLRKLKPSAPRQTAIRTIDLHDDRAVVSCIVTLDPETEPMHFHNIRLFVKDAGQWRILGWANEPIESDAAE